MTTRSRHLLLAGLALITGCTLLNDPGKIEPGPDTTPPAAPTGLAALPGITQVTLTWDGSTEWDFDHFVVYSAQTTQTLVKVGEAPSPTFTITGLDNALVYDFVVVAVDRFGNVSDPSTLVTAQPDGVAPTVVASYNPGPQSGANLMTDVIFTFSEPMDRASIEANATVDVTCGASPVCLWTFFNEDTEAKCDLVLDGNPSAQFGYNVTCGVTLGTGVTDRAGNGLAGAPFTASFTTASAPDTTAPTFTSATVATSGSATTAAGSVSPGATGAFPETNVVITFSEAMNPTATQGAITVNGGAGYNGGAFSWDATGSVVTFNPDVNYPPGTVVTVTVGVGATDLAGNPLAAAVTRYFRAAYQATETVASDPVIAGYAYVTFGGGSINTYPSAAYMYAGDSYSNDTYVGFISFPLTGLAHTPSRYKAAVLGVHQGGTTGAPYTDLRRQDYCFPILFGGYKCFYTYLQASHVNLGASLDATDVTTAVLAGSWEIATSATAGVYSRDVAAALERDRLDGRTRNQWRLNFPTATDIANDADYAWFESASSGTVANRPTLVVTYEYAAP